MIINNNLEKFKAIDGSLNGEVLLEVTVDSNDNITGYITAPLSVCNEMKNKTPAERKDAGWDKYEEVLLTLN